MITIRQKQTSNEFYSRFIVLLLISLCIYLILNDSLKYKNTIEFYEYLEGAVFHIHIIPYVLLSKIYEIFNITIKKGYVAFKIPVSILDFCGSILVCQSHRMNTRRRSWFKSLVECTFMQFGGTTLTGIVLGQTPSWILSSNAFPALFVAWYLTYFCPYDAYYTLLTSFIGIPILLFANIGSAISSGHAVTSWGLDKAAFNAFHKNSHRLSGSVLTCIISGTLSACGGGLITTYFDFFGTKSDFKLHTLNKSFWLALLYYCLLNKNKDLPWDQQFSKEFGHSVIINLQLLNLVLQSVKRDFDIFERLSNLVCRVFSIAPETSPDKLHKD